MTYPTFHFRVQQVEKALREAVEAKSGTQAIKLVWQRAQGLLDDLGFQITNPESGIAAECLALAKRLQSAAIDAWVEAGSDPNFIPRVEVKRAAGVSTTPTALAISTFQQEKDMADSYVADDLFAVQMGGEHE